MSVLLAVIPYLVTIIIYCITVSQIFSTSRQMPPKGWPWIMASPIAVGGLAPLSLASKVGLGREARLQLLLAVAVAIAFVVCVLTALQGEARYRWLERTVSVGALDAKPLRWRHLLACAGVAVLVYGAVVNVIAGNS